MTRKNDSCTIDLQCHVHLTIDSIMIFVLLIYTIFLSHSKKRSVLCSVRKITIIMLAYFANVSESSLNSETPSLGHDAVPGLAILIRGGSKTIEGS